MERRNEFDSQRIHEGIPEDDKEVSSNSNYQERQGKPEDDEVSRNITSHALSSPYERLCELKHVIVEGSQNQFDSQDPLEYYIDSEHPSLVTIFNMVNFKGNEDMKREGSDSDVESLIYSIAGHKITIEPKYVCKDFTRQNVLDKINSVCHDLNSGLRNQSSLICIFLTHGSEGDLLSCVDGTISTSEVIQPFSQCEKLSGKPKLFIFQACKSKTMPTDDIQKYTTSSIKDVKPLVSELFWKTNLPQDTIVAYSTLEDEVSLRDTVKGTWFIQVLCRNIHGYGRKEDIHSILLRTNKCILAYYSYKLNNRIIYKQLPIFASTLRKKWFLNKSKERQFLLDTRKSLNDVIENLNVK